MTKETIKHAAGKLFWLAALGTAWAFAKTGEFFVGAALFIKTKYEATSFAK